MVGEYDKRTQPRGRTQGSQRPPKPGMGQGGMGTRNKTPATTAQTFAQDSGTSFDLISPGVMTEGN